MRHETPMRHDGGPADQRLRTEDLAMPDRRDERPGYAEQSGYDQQGGYDERAGYDQAGDEQLHEERAHEQRAPEDRAHGDQPTGEQAGRQWDGTPAHDPGPPVDQDTAHGYADIAALPVPGGPADRRDEAAGDDDETAGLFTGEQVERFRGQWQSIQAAFVDDPTQAVREADHLVAEVMRTLAATFAEHKRDLEGQWQRGSEVGTEDLRLALRRYRSFFNQLLHG